MCEYVMACIYPFFASMFYPICIMSFRGSLGLACLLTCHVPVVYSASPGGFEDLLRSRSGVTKDIIYTVLYVYASSTWHMAQYPKVATTNSIIAHICRKSTLPPFWRRLEGPTALVSIAIQFRMATGD